eukprot:5409930-Alexandrium_andersonii.AAC.1
MSETETWASQGAGRPQELLQGLGRWLSILNQTCLRIAPSRMASLQAPFKAALQASFEAAFEASFPAPCQASGPAPPQTAGAIRGIIPGI